jgi:hypothetical protein
VYRYPIAFSVLVLPLSIVRFIHFGQIARGMSSLASSATIGGTAIYDLHGLVEVVIFFQTRQGLLLFGQDHDGLEMDMDRILKNESIPMIGLDDEEDVTRASP